MSHAEALEVHVERSGRSLRIKADEHEIRLETRGPAEPNRTDDGFAAILTLPLAMREGRSLRLRGAGDPKLAERLTALSEVWECWTPGLFAAVPVTFDEAVVPRDGAGRLVLYSGGADATHNLLRYRGEPEKPALLTMFGLDYRLPQRASFDALMRKTEPFRRTISDRHLLIETDLYRTYFASGIGEHFGHAFALAGGLFLFSETFAAGEIAADYNAAQEYVVHPWGTNSFTNAFFAGSTFRMETASTDITRTQKLRVLAGEDETVLGALSFCHNPKTRPENCGRCSKCVRTKAMFMATLGRVPPVFLDTSLDADMIRSMKVEKRNERGFTMDIFFTARRNGHLDKLPGLAEIAARYMVPPARSGTPSVKIAGGLGSRLRAWATRYLPGPR